MPGRHYTMTPTALESVIGMLGLESASFLGGKLTMAHTATTWVPFAEGCILLSIGKEGEFQKKAGTSTHTGTRVQGSHLSSGPWFSSVLP